MFGLGESVLPTQRQFRHLRGIHLRNIASTQLIDSFFALRSNEHVLYCSNTTYASVNPTWMFDDQESNTLSSFNDQGPEFVVEVYEKPKTLNIDTCSLIETPFMLEQFHVIFSCTFKFSELVFLCTPSRFRDEMPLNCILFEFQDGIFVTTQEAATMGTEPNKLTNNEIIPLDSSPIEIPCEEFQRSVAKLVGLNYSITQVENDVTKAKQHVEQHLQTQERVLNLRQEIELRKSKINRLKLIIKEKEAQNLERKTLHNNYQIHQIDSESQFKRSSQLLETSQQQFQQVEKPSIEQLRSQLSQLQRKTNRRQKTIVKCLSDNIFVITPHTAGGSKMQVHLTVNGLSIYKGDQLGTDDEAASALGFVAHCVRIISKLFQIPLKFQVFPLASRSFVRDETTNEQNQKPLLPLFMLRGSEKPKYMRAIILLNLNIYHILKVKGYKKALKNKFDVIENLQYLLEICGDV